MITTAEFKKKLAKPFGREMRNYSFKGTGFEYFIDNDDYLISVFIEPERWGSSCSAGFAIHPKIIERNSNGKLDFKKLKIHNYEFKFRLTDFARGERWDYAEDEFSNLITLSQIIQSIKRKAFPVIEQFQSVPNILDQFEVKEMNDFHANWIKRTGVFISTTDTRFAWAMTVIYENKNPKKAKSFAEWALLQPHEIASTFFGDEDFHRVLNK